MLKQWAKVIGQSPRKAESRQTIDVSGQEPSGVATGEWVGPDPHLVCSDPSWD